MTDRSDAERTALQVKLLRIRLRYEEKTAAIFQAVILLERVQKESVPNPEIAHSLAKFEKYLQPNGLGLENFFAGMLLVSAITEAEAYFVEVLRAIIAEFPKKVGAVSFKLSEVLDASREELVTAAAEDYLNRLMYKKPADYLTDLSSVLSIDHSTLQSDWPQFVEGKARRDLGIHNGWIANAVYRRKVQEAGMADLPAEGTLMAPDFHYVMEMVKTCDRVVRNIHEQLNDIHKPSSE